MSFRPPVRAVADQLVWGADGSWWAVWRVDPLVFAYRSQDQRLDVHRRLRGLIANVGEALLLSVVERVGPWDVAAEMAEGVPPSRRAVWDEVCAATAAQLDDMVVTGTGSARSGVDEQPLVMGRRRFYLAVKLPAAGGIRGAVAALRLAVGEAGTAAGLGPVLVPEEDLVLRQRQARAVAASLGRSVPLTAASAGEIRWLYARALLREIDEPGFDPGWEPRGRSVAGGRVSASVARLFDAELVEGVEARGPARPRGRGLQGLLAPADKAARRKRFVRVDAAGGSAYHALFALSDMPHDWEFPTGVEWFLFPHAVEFGVDWAMRLRVRDRHAAQRGLSWRRHELTGQLEQYEGDPTGLPESVLEAVEGLEDQRNALDRDRTERSVEATVILSVAGPTVAVMEERAAALQTLFAEAAFTVSRPTGGQIGLLASMLPGAPAAPVCRHYTQFWLTRDTAAGAPLCGGDVGDTTGGLLGLTSDNGGFTPVFLDPSSAPTDRTPGRSWSGSMAVAGETGAGKSQTLKRIAFDHVARGGQLVAADRSEHGEYVTFAKACPGRAQILELRPDTNVCLDPMRVFTGELAQTVTLGFLGLLAGVSQQDPEGNAIADAVEAVLHSRRGGSIRDVVSRLEAMGESGDDPAGRVARSLRAYARLGLSSLVFGDGQLVEGDADVIVFWCPGLQLPDRQQLLEPHLAKQIPPAALFGQALLYLLTAHARRIVLANSRRSGAILLDEFWALANNPYGAQLAEGIAREGRRSNAFLLVSSQDPRDFANEALLAQIPYRAVFRCDAAVVPDALEFLGLTGSHDATGALKGGLGDGECLLRDGRGRVGLVQVLEPALAGLVDAFSTTPTLDVDVADIEPGPLEPDSVDAGTETAAVLPRADRGRGGHHRHPVPPTPSGRRRRPRSSRLAELMEGEE